MVSDFMSRAVSLRVATVPLMLHNFDRAKKEDQDGDKKHKWQSLFRCNELESSGRTVFVKHDLRVARFYELQDAPRKTVAKPAGIVYRDTTSSTGNSVHEVRRLRSIFQ